MIAGTSNFLIVYPHIAIEETNILNAYLCDIMPTILSIFGFLSDGQMNNSLLSIVEPINTGECPSSDQEQVASTDNIDMEQRLADLGYLK